MLKEFRDFAVKGNVVDLAVAVVIGGAFGKIVTSLVNDIIMPILGILIGGINFENLKWVISPANGDIAEVAIRYGAFLQSMVDFLIISFSIFIFVKILTSFKKKSSAPEVVSAAPAKEVLLLEEIRDLLKEKQENK